MADYLTEDKVARRVGARALIELTQDSGADVVDGDVLEQCIAWSEARMNAVLISGYGGSLPINVKDHGQTAYDTVVGLCLDVVVYSLYSRRPKLVTEKMTKDYEDALMLGERMAKGRHAIGIPPVPRSGAEAVAVTHSTISTRTSSERPDARNWTRKSQGNA